MKRLSRLLARPAWWGFGWAVFSLLYWLLTSYPYLTCLVAGILVVESGLVFNRYVDEWVSKNTKMRVRKLVDDRWEKH